MSWRDTGVISHKGGGFSYFRLRTGFAINEAQFPNICVIWGGFLAPMVYIAISPRLKWRWVKKKHART